MDRGKELAEGSSPGVDPATGAVTPSRYESQKRRDWNTFGQFLRNQRPPMSLPRCSSNHVLDFLRYLDQFGKTKVHLQGCKNAEFNHEVDGNSSQYQKRAVSTEYSSIHSSIDQFIEKNINTIGYDQVKLGQYGMPRLRAFIKLKIFQMAEESGLMLVMDSTNTSNMLKHFEEPLLRDCIQEIQKGPIRKELIKTFAQPESKEEKLDRIMKISLDGAKQGAAVVVGYVLSSYKSGVVLYVMIFALFMGISFSMLAHLLRKHVSVSKVLTKLGIMGTASSVILSFAALIPKVIISCTFGTIAILLLAFMLMMN